LTPDRITAGSAKQIGEQTRGEIAAEAATGTGTDGAEAVAELPTNGAQSAGHDGARTAVDPRMPGCFIIGQPKSGTTALWEMLRLHPQIYMPERKEPRFFVEEMRYRDPPRPGGTPKTMEEYLSWFAGAAPGQLIAEASPWYLWSPTAPARIARARPDARLIAILREPASQIRSLHLELVQLYVETETDLRRAIELEGPRAEGREVPRHTYWPNLLRYSEQAHVVEQLRRYEQLFAPEQLLVLIYDDFRNDNAGTLRRVLDFLGVDQDFPLPVKDANPTVRVRSRRMHELVHAVSVGHGPFSNAAKALVKALTPRPLRRRALYATQRRLVWTEPDPPDEELMRELRRRFKGDVEALSEHLGRDLVALWGYEDLD
jgi:hypothetical protein